jgi:predicted lipoprotein with Yx(FWY)xxD motif
MNRMLGTIALCLTLSGTIVACGSDDEGSNQPATNSTDDKSAAVTNASDGAREEKRSGVRSSRRGASVKVMQSRYGRMLFDGRGRALYLFTRERTSRSRCYGDCAEAWPPFLTRGKPRARTGVKSRLLGTTRRRDGRMQVTYRGQPLYYYVDDRQPGQVLCQDVVEFGGTWLVVSPSGEAIR